MKKQKPQLKSRIRKRLLDNEDLMYGIAKKLKKSFFTVRNQVYNKSSIMCRIDHEEAIREVCQIADEESIHEMVKV